MAENTQEMKFPVETPPFTEWVPEGDETAEVGEDETPTAPVDYREGWDSVKTTIDDDPYGHATIDRTTKIRDDR